MVGFSHVLHPYFPTFYPQTKIPLLNLAKNPIFAPELGGSRFRFKKNKSIIANGKRW